MKCKSGYVQTGDKCVKKRGISTGRRKYNPFKMWGSWVGAGVGLISFPIIQTIRLSSLWGKFGVICSTVAGSDYCGSFSNFVMKELLPIPGTSGFFNYVGLILGFLIGWAIHSLIRKLKK